MGFELFVACGSPKSSCEPMMVNADPGIWLEVTNRLLLTLLSRVRSIVLWVFLSIKKDASPSLLDVSLASRSTFREEGVTIWESGVKILLNHPSDVRFGST